MYSPITGCFSHTCQDVGLVCESRLKVLNNVVVVVKALAIVEREKSTGVFGSEIVITIVHKCADAVIGQHWQCISEMIDKVLLTFSILHRS